MAVYRYPQEVHDFVKKWAPKLRDQDYYDLFEESDPIDVSRWRTHSKDHPPRRQEHPADSIYPQMPEDDPGPSMDTTPSHYPQMPEDDS